MGPREAPEHPDWGLWPQGAGGRLILCRVACVVVRGAWCLFFVWS